MENVAALAQRHQPDLLLMQEATAEIDHLPERLGGHYARIALPGRQHGLAAWSPHRLFSPATNMGSFSVANVHLSHGQIMNRRQLRRIATALPERAAILGDCNMVGAPFLPGYKDVGSRQATHRMSNVIPLRLDRCFIRNLHCIAFEVLDQGASDHRPLKVVLADGK